MKKNTLIGLSAVAVVGLILLLSQRAGFAKDKALGQKLAGELPGVWSLNRGLYKMYCTNVVAADGSFTGQLIFIHPGRTNSYQMTGSWRIQDGSLIETITSDSNMAARTPRTHSGRIVQADEHEFTVLWQGTTNKSTWHKVIE